MASGSATARTGLVNGRFGLSRKLIIGLVGGIGSGKSTVARHLAQLGAAVIDSDRINRAQLALPEVVDELRSWWGDSILQQTDGGRVVDRRRVAEIIFDAPDQRVRLERLLHPRIEKERERLIERYERDPDIKLIVLDAPLLLEAGLKPQCDAVVYVHADDEVRYARVRATRGWSESEWKRREKSQFALDKKRARSDHVIVNNSSDPAQLREAVAELYCKLTANDITARSSR